MRIRDWSSDVCSSDLVGVVPRRARGPAAGAQQQPGVARAVFMAVLAVDRFALRHAIILPVDSGRHEIGRASCRERVCQSVLLLVVAVSLNKQNTTDKLT